MTENRQNLTISKKEIVKGMEIGDYFWIKNIWIRITKDNLFHVKTILFLSFKW